MNPFRTSFAALILASTACGPSSPSSSPGSAASVAPATHRLTLTIQGAGRIQTGVAPDCRATCTVDVASPGPVTLVAIAETGNGFAGWSGACSGGGACSVVLDADRAVTATFSTLPPSSLPPSSPPPPSPPPPGVPAKRVLLVATSGGGSVTSAPEGIDCGAICTAEFDDGVSVTLTARPNAGWQFGGWGGACSGSQGCTVAVGATAPRVAASFVQIPLPATAECDGLLPARLSEPVVASLPGGADCTEGASDDGTGNFALGYEEDGGVASYRTWWFFTVREGTAVRVGGEVPGEGFSMSSQPTGFTRFGAPFYAASASLSWYSPDGALQSAADFGPGAQDDFHFQASAAADPSGGMVVVRSHSPAGAWVSEYERFDKTGAVEVPWVAIPGGSLAVVAVGVALSGHVLVLSGSPDSFQNQKNRQARWLGRDGTPMTEWFAVADPTIFPTFEFLVDGSLVLRETLRSPGIEAPYQARFEDGRASSSALPDWLAQRRTNGLGVIRSGKGYASWGASGPCGGQVEVLAASGTSCGCIPVPRVGLGTTTGRDGSLMVPWTEFHSSGPGTCKYDLYPQLLK
jgi:hypothetical protein